MVLIFVSLNKLIRACTMRLYTPSVSCYFYKNNPAPLYSMRREALLFASRGDDERTCSKTSSQLVARCIGPTTPRVDEHADSVRVRAQRKLRAHTKWIFHAKSTTVSI